MPVASATETHSLARARSSPGRTPPPPPPPGPAPRLAPAITPGPPPQITTAPASASSRPTASATCSCASVAFEAPITAMYGALHEFARHDDPLADLVTVQVRFDPIGVGREPLQLLAAGAGWGGDPVTNL